MIQSIESLDRKLIISDCTACPHISWSVHWVYELGLDPIPCCSYDSNDLVILKINPLKSKIVIPSDTCPLLIDD